MFASVRKGRSRTEGTTPGKNEGMSIGRYLLYCASQLPIERLSAIHIRRFVDSSPLAEGHKRVLHGPERHGVLNPAESQPRSSWRGLGR